MRAMQLAEIDRAAAHPLHPLHPLRAIERPDPTPGEAELVLRVTACAVCRTDLQLCEGELEARRLPVVPGHQIVGRVATVGRGVAGWGVGERAGVAWLA